VNLLVVDKNFNFIDAAWDQINGGEQIGADPKAAHDYMTQEYVAREEGYIYVYVSNENSTLVEVYFDDVVVTHTPGNVIQANEYYPYGLQAQTSWTRESNVANNFLYNGGTELNKTTQVYDLYYRNYDPVLGKFGQVDPVAGKYGSMSPFSFSNDDPVFWNDPQGDDPSYDAIRIDSRIYSALMSMLSNPYTNNPYLHGDDMPADPGRQSGGGGGSMFGGSWSPSGGTELFGSEDEAFSAGYAYNEMHNSWSSTIHADGAAAFNSYIEKTVMYQMAFASLDPQTPAWSPVKLKDATVFDIARAFQYAHVIQTTATEENPFFLNIYDLFDEEGAQISGQDIARHWEKEFLDRGVRVFIILPNNHKVGRIDTVLPYYPQKGGTQKGFDIDYQTVPTDSKVTKYGYGIAIYGANDAGGNERLASMQFIPKLVDNFLGIRAFVFKNERKMQLPTKVDKK
jgi:RHS repeat-associated protein